MKFAGLVEVNTPKETHTFQEKEGLKYFQVDNTEVGLPPNSDLEPGKYEGGLRIWECSIDLLRYLKTIRIPQRVLELGCGHGLPGVYCMQQGAQVVFQDFNKEVLEYATMNNVKANCGSLEGTFLAGEWQDMSHLGKFGLILSSETIYNPLNYQKLLTAIKSSCEGFALIACKAFYFGVGGGSESFIKEAQNWGFEAEIVEEIQEVASTRHIIKLTPT